VFSPLLFLLLAFPATAAAPIPLPAENQTWIRVRTPRFTIVSSASERRTREVAERLEALATSLRQVNERFDGRPIDTRVLIFNRRRDSQPFFDLLLNQQRAEAPGVFVAHADGSGTMVIDAGREWDRTLFHELIHNLLAGSGAHLPLWLEEGLAEYFSSAVIRGRHIILGRAITEHQRVLWSRTLIPLKDVLTAPRSTPLVTHAMFYPESWGIVDWMMRAGRPRFYRLLADVEAGLPASDALRKHYSVDEGFIERALRKPPITPPSTITVSVEPVERVKAVEPLSRPDALYQIGIFLGALEVSAPDAERFFRAALELDSGHAHSLAGLGNLRSRQKNYDEAYAFYERAVKAAPDDPEVQLDFAQALMRDTIGAFTGVLPLGGDAPPRARKARELAARALQNGGDVGRANAVIGSTYRVQKDVGPGIPALETALQLKPARSDVALNLYALYLRSGDRARAEALFEQRFARARNPEVTLAARTIFAQEQMIVANRHMAANDFAKAEALVQEIADLTTDPVAKMNLQNQLRSLRETLATNAQIVAFNDAVSAANRGETRAAMKMVDNLLQRATDERVISDSKRLREMLEWRLRRERR